MRAAFEKLADFINYEDDPPVPGAALDEIEHLFDAFILAVTGADFSIVEGFRVRPNIGVELGHDAGGERDPEKKVVLKEIP